MKSHVKRENRIDVDGVICTDDDVIVAGPIDDHAFRLDGYASFVDLFLDLLPDHGYVYLRVFVTACNGLDLLLELILGHVGRKDLKPVIKARDDCQNSHKCFKSFH